MATVGAVCSIVGDGSGVGVLLWADTRLSYEKNEKTTSKNIKNRLIEKV